LIYELGSMEFQTSRCTAMDVQVNRATSFLTSLYPPSMYESPQ